MSPELDQANAEIARLRSELEARTRPAATPDATLLAISAPGAILPREGGYGIDGDELESVAHWQMRAVLAVAGAVLQLLRERAALGRCARHPDAFGYEHTECGFHWHGKDASDVPATGGFTPEPVCPRCELGRAREHIDADHALLGSLRATIEAHLGTTRSEGVSAPQWWALPDRPRIVCLCGSTRFYDQFRAANLRLTLAGEIVLSIGCDTSSDADLTAAGQMGGDPEPVKERLDELHRHKIAIADYVLVLNVGGYIGDSTRREIQYATALGKPVTYLEEQR